MNEEYEAVFVLRIYKDKERIKEIIKKIDEIVIAERCEIIKRNDMGMRKLPYKINKETIAYYYTINFNNNGKKKNVIRNITIKANTMEEILKHVVIKKDI